MKQLAVVLALVFAVIAALSWSLLFRGRPSKAEWQKQRATYAEMNAVADGLRAYEKAHGGAYPVATSSEQLEKILVPAYADRVPHDDAWMHALRYVSWPEGFAIASSGRDGKWEVSDPRQYAQQVYIMESPDEDQVISIRNTTGILTRSWGCQCGGESNPAVSAGEKWFYAATVSSIAFLASMITALVMKRRERVPSST